MHRRALIGGAFGMALSAVGRPAIAHPPNELPDYDLPTEMLPKIVTISESFRPFEIHVFPDEFGLYWTLPGNLAMRYVVGIGRPGLYVAGEFYVGAKKEWPSWTPTPGMLRREPQVYSRWRGGMPGGLNNPLGARALYLFRLGRGDTFLRIHGTNDPTTLGRRVSNGCARLVNDQIIDLYDRIPLETRVVLYPPTV
jgi:lipoprotein-anchoring transpeptidase ErfK/SrfK